MQSRQNWVTHMQGMTEGKGSRNKEHAASLHQSCACIRCQSSWKGKMISQETLFPKDGNSENTMTYIAFFFQCKLAALCTHLTIIMLLPLCLGV